MFIKRFTLLIVFILFPLYVIGQDKPIGRNSILREKPNGTKQIIISAGIWNYKPDGKTWKPCNFKIKPVNKFGYKYGIIEDKMIRLFPDSSNGWVETKVFNKYKIRQRFLGYGFFDKNLKDFTFTKAKVVPLQIEDNTAYYRNIYNGVDLYYKSFGNWLKVYLDIPADLRIKISKPANYDNAYIGLVTEVETDMSFKDVENLAVLKAGFKVNKTRVKVFDSLNLPKFDLPFSRAFIGDSVLTLEKAFVVKNGKKYIISAIPYNAFIDTVKYSGNVIFDPTVTIGPSDTTQMKDAFTNHEFPNAQAGTDGHLIKIGNYSSIDDRDRRGYIWFDLSQIFSMSTITSAICSLYVDEIENDPYIALYSVNDSWNENDITWNNQPSYGSIIETVHYTSVDNWYSYNVLNYVDSCVCYGKNNYGVVFIGNPVEHDHYINFPAKEYVGTDPSKVWRVMIEYIHSDTINKLIFGDYDGNSVKIDSFQYTNHNEKWYDIYIYNTYMERYFNANGDTTSTPVYLDKDSWKGVRLKNIGLLSVNIFKFADEDDNFVYYDTLNTSDYIINRIKNLFRFNRNTKIR